MRLINIRNIYFLSTHVNNISIYLIHMWTDLKYLALLEPSLDRKLNHKCLRVSVDSHGLWHIFLHGIALVESLNKQHISSLFWFQITEAYLFCSQLQEPCAFRDGLTLQHHLLATELSLLEWENYFFMMRKHGFPTVF